MLRIFRKFFDFCGEANKKKFYQSLVCGVLLAFMEALKIPAIMLMLQGAISGTVTAGLIWKCLGILLFSVAGGSAVKYFSTIWQCEAGYRTAADKRMEIAEHLRYLPMGYFNQNSLGYITSVATNTMENLADVATRVVMLVTQGVLTTAMITLMIFLFDWRIGLTALVGLLLFFGVNSLMQKRSKKIAPRKIETDSRLVERVVEYVQGIAEVREYNLTGKTAERLNKAIDENSDVNIQMELIFVPLMALQNGVVKVTGVAMTLLSVWFYLAGTMELINCIGMCICSFLVFASLEQAGSYSALLRTVDLSVDKALAVFAMPAMDIDGKEILPGNHDVELSAVDFSYDRKKIIDNLSVRIPERTTTAIVGPSGGGKTTLCHLIARFWDVKSGQVLVRGADIRKVPLSELMDHISMVFQRVYLFQDTIYNNIRMGRPEADRQEVMEAAKKARCYDFIMALPDGFETMVGEGGESLSGGEKQRISIARCILKDAPIVILDEATASVDADNESYIQQAISELCQGKTLLVIAHRLNTIRNADKIMVVADGSIVQSGAHEALMEQEGIYRNFVTMRENSRGWSNRAG